MERMFGIIHKALVLRSILGGVDPGLVPGLWASSLRFNRAKLKTITLCCAACFWPVWAPCRSDPESLLDPRGSAGKADVCLCRQTAQLRRRPLHAYSGSFHTRSCIGKVLSKPQGGTEVGARLIYVCGEAAGRFNDPPLPYHRPLCWWGHANVTKTHPE